MLKFVLISILLLASLVLPALADESYPYMTPPDQGPLSYSINVTTTAWTQVGPKGVPGKVIYVDGVIAPSEGEQVAVGVGTGGCRTVEPFFSKYVGPTGAFEIFSWVVPRGKTMCLRQSSAHATLGGYINALVR